MDRGMAGRIQEWDTRPVSSGYDGLGELGEASFSGAVTTGTAWLFMLNGRILGVAGGTLSSFESSDLTAHEAPDPGLPLLFAMQERGGDTRAKYYTDDNPLPEVHETLSEAGFTGYLELSDNVLSGDYYVVYYGGRSMSVAFVGNAAQLVSGDDAFRRAADEVGIYEVKDVELDVRNVPEPAADDGGDVAVAPEPDEADEPEASPVNDDEAGAEEPTVDAPGEPSPTDPVEDATTPSRPDAGTPEPTAAGAPEKVDDAPTPAGAEAREHQPAAEAPEPAPSDPEDPFSEEAAWRETRTIPALDPEETSAPPAANDGGQHAPVEPTPQPVEQPDEPAPSDGDDRLAALESAIERQSETIAELESKLEASAAEADQLREERATLERQVESAVAEHRAGPSGEPLDAETALDQTDLFVRYGTKGGGTLEKAHDGLIDRDEVVTNLRIDHHTRFEESGVTVEGRPFETFLDESLEYRFVVWLVTELLFEIEATGSQRGLRELFDAIPLIDRAEFHGTVTWRDQEAGETYEETFDVVCRDRMGRPLVVANLNDDRDPATGEMMGGLIEGASAVADGHETLGGTFMVTSSFFRPDALEAAGDATGAGLLSREKRWSYVKRTRRAGYHLCLVEARGDDFHVAVPEL